jgi:hypothetical protein
MEYSFVFHLYLVGVVICWRHYKTSLTIDIDIDIDIIDIDIQTIIDFPFYRWLLNTFKRRHGAALIYYGNSFHDCAELLQILMDRRCLLVSCDDANEERKTSILKKLKISPSNCW